MEIYKYPVVCWELSETHVCCHVAGAGYELVGTSLTKIKSSLASRIMRELETGNVNQPSITEPRLKTVKVGIRPAYKEEDGIYAAPSVIHLSVPAVYGRTTAGYFECFLPLLDEEFYYYRPDQLKHLVEHFTRNSLKDLAPETVHRLLLAPPARLELLPVKVKVRRSFSGRGFTDYASEVPLLSTIAEKFPHPKSIRKKISAFPDAAWERAGHITAVKQKILDEKANLLIVGEKGVGKSAILLEAIRSISKLKGLDEEEKQTFWRTPAQRITARARYLGEWEEICETMAEELRRVNGVLWVTDFINLLRTGGEDPGNSVAAFFAGILKTAEFQILGEVTGKELESVRHLLPGFAALFQTIHIEVMNRAEILRVFDHFENYARMNFDIGFEENSLNLAGLLLGRYVKYESFPGKAIKFLSGCLDECWVKEKKEITKRDILDSLIEITGLPEMLLRDEMTLDRKELRRWFGKRIIGQDNAVEKMCTVVEIFKAGLNDPGKPIATMIFGGPTGTGKTASARALAEYFFGQGQKLDPLIRLDMSEFQHPSQIEKLLGSGDEPGKLVREIRDRPFSVVLLDELEKAHESFFDALLSILDEGLLLDAFGRATDFRTSIVIMTTNLGSSASGSIGFAREQPTSADYSASIKSYFRPEFFNRIDSVVSFNPLGQDTVEAITRKELLEFTERKGITERGLRLEFTENLVGYLARTGFDNRYGARPLQRAMERYVTAAIARYLLRYPKVSDCILEIDFREEKVAVRKKR